MRAGNEGSHMTNMKKTTKQSMQSTTPGAPDEGRDTTITLGAGCTMVEIDALEARFAAVLARGEVPVIDVSELKVIDSAGLELLTAFVMALSRLGKPVRWRGEPAALLASR